MSYADADRAGDKRDRKSIKWERVPFRSKIHVIDNKKVMYCAVFS